MRCHTAESWTTFNCDRETLNRRMIHMLSECVERVNILFMSAFCNMFIPQVHIMMKVKIQYIAQPCWLSWHHPETQTPPGSHLLNPKSHWHLMYITSLDGNDEIMFVINYYINTAISICSWACPAVTESPNCDANPSTVLSHYVDMLTFPSFLNNPATRSKHSMSTVKINAVSNTD